MLDPARAAPALLQYHLQNACVAGHCVAGHCVAGHCVAAHCVAIQCATPTPVPMSPPRTGPAWGPPPRAARGRPGGPGARRPPRSPGCRPCRPRTRAAAPTRAAPSPQRCRARTMRSSTCPRSLRWGRTERADAACAEEQACTVFSARGGTTARARGCCQRRGRASRGIGAHLSCTTRHSAVPTKRLMQAIAAGMLPHLP